MAMDPPAILDLWERVEGMDALGRSVSLATATEDELAPQDALMLAVGERDRRLLHLRSMWSENDIVSVVDCPACGVSNEFTTDVSGLSDLEPASPEPISPEGRTIFWRPIDSADLMLAASSGSIEDAERVLIERFLIAIDGRHVGAEDLSQAERKALAAALEEADPLSEVRGDLTCAACGHRFVAEVDIAGSVWSELSHHAHRLLMEVDTLARRYGWTEAECLRLSPTRRAWYLSMATGASW